MYIQNVPVNSAEMMEIRRVF